MLEDTILSTQVITAKFERPLGYFLVDHNAKISQRYFGPTSLEALMHEMKNKIIEPLSNTGSTNQILSECALLAHRKLDLLINREDELIKDGSAPTAPPFSVLEAMIEPYFTTINPYFPIWTKENFTRLVTASQESGYPDEDRAYIICSNNLILMTLAANSLRYCPAKQVPSKHTRITSSMDSDLIRSFLANAKRAIENIELLLSPRLICVQALLSLCVVAQEHLSTRIFRMLFDLAAHSAKCIGLHQWQYSRDQIGEEDTQERQNVSYCLYILDKVVCRTTGTSPSILTSDVHIVPALISPDNEAASYLVAKAKLAKIEETVYLEIYSNQAEAKTDDQVRQVVYAIHQKLQNWLADSGIIIEDVETDVTGVSVLKTELSVAFFSAQLLLIRPFQGHSDAIFQHQKVAKMCMRLLLRLWRSTSELGHFVTFPCIIASHPALYLYEICAHITSGHGEDSDIELLQSYIDMLQAITHLREDNSYNGRLYEISLILMDVIAAAKAQGKRRNPPTNPERPTEHTQCHRSTPSQSPRSDTTSASNNRRSARFQEDHQSVNSFMLPDLDDSLILNTPTNSEDHGSTDYSAGELAAIISGKDWTEPEHGWFQGLGLENGNDFDESDVLKYAKDYY